MEYLRELGDTYKCLEKRLEFFRVNQEQWKRDKTYLWHEDRILVPSDRIPALLEWTHESSGRVGANHTVKLFKTWFHTTWSDDQLRNTLQPIVDKCPCRSCKPGDVRDRSLYSTLPIPHCANNVLYVDYTKVPTFWGLHTRPTGDLRVDQAHPSVSMHPTHHWPGDHEGTPGRVVQCLRGT